MEFLEKIRNKSEEDKVKIAISLTALFLFIVLFFWITNFDIVFKNINSESEIKQNELSPFSLITDKVGAFIGTIREEVVGLGMEKKEVFERVK